jgi:hypothetical protein
MHHDAEFANYILSDTTYARFPEVVEFYTGIDRRRSDALNVLTEDLRRGVAAIKTKCGLPDDINIYPLIQWQPTEESLDAMREVIKLGVASSSLPDAIKDRYADRAYDRSKPYDQAVRSVLAGDSIVSVMLTLVASARALRNSDYVDPECRRALLDQILRGWKELVRILWVLLPLLAEKSRATFDGIIFLVSPEFGSEPDERFRNILIALPKVVVSWYSDDLYSPKMGPLLLQRMEAEEDELVKHELALLLIAKMPMGWRASVEAYIVSNNKNSFYLLDIYMRLRSVYQFAFLKSQDIRDLEYLIKMVALKHKKGVKHPGVKAIKKIPDSVLPERPQVSNENE